VLEVVKSHLAATSLILFSAHAALPLLYFARSPLLARALILHSFPAQARPIFAPITSVVDLDPAGSEIIGKLGSESVN
jgi:hypothetical protein